MQTDTITDQERVTAFRERMSEVLSTGDVDGMNNCVGCGKCGNMCTWSLVGDTHPLKRADAIRTAFRAVDPKVVRRQGTGIAMESIRALPDKVFGSCTMCGRCGLACSQGRSQRNLVYGARSALLKAGLAPKWARDISVNARTHGNTFGRTPEEVWGDMQRRAQGIVTIPFNRRAEWMAGCSAIASAKAPDVAVNALALLVRAGISITVPWDLTDTLTEANTAVYDKEASDAHLKRTIAAIRKFGCRGMIAGECGCDQWWALIGAGQKFRKAGIEVVTFDQLMLSAVRQGRIKPRRLRRSVTYHDSCWGGRLTGDFETPRALLGACVDRIVEMTPNREENYCCTGGAGMMPAYPSSDPVQVENRRRKASALKAEQLRRAMAQGATEVVVSCASCYLSISDIIKHYRLSMKVAMLNVVLGETLAQ